MTKQKKTRNPKPRGRGPGPVTNRRKRNEPITRQDRRDYQRHTAVDDPGPDDLTHFDATPEQQAADFFNSRAILVRDDE